MIVSIVVLKWQLGGVGECNNGEGDDAKDENLAISAKVGDAMWR